MLHKLKLETITFFRIKLLDTLHWSIHSHSFAIPDTLNFGARDVIPLSQRPAFAIASGTHFMSTSFHQVWLADMQQARPLVQVTAVHKTSPLKQLEICKPQQASFSFFEDLHSLQMSSPLSIIFLLSEAAFAWLQDSMGCPLDCCWSWCVELSFSQAMLPC